MFRFFSRPTPLVLALTFFTFIPIMTALVLVFQIPFGTYPEESTRLAIAPIAWFAHVLAGVAFGITGPVQFVRALRSRFGALHRVLGRIFVLSAAILGLSGLSLLAQVLSQRTPLVDIARGLFSMALLIALALAMAAIRNRDFIRHRDWVIRAYAIGMGLGCLAGVFSDLPHHGSTSEWHSLRHPLRRLVGSGHCFRRGGHSPPLQFIPQVPT